VGQQSDQIEDRRLAIGVKVTQAGGERLGESYVGHEEAAEQESANDQASWLEAGQLADAILDTSNCFF
jgi:hypothetical protein